jgi:hypothetical protein
VYRREAPGERAATVLLNFTGEDREVSVEAGSIAVSTGMDRIGEAVDGHLRLGPDEGVVVLHPAGG